MTSVKPSYLDEAIETMHQDYGSIDGYVSEGLGLDPDAQAALRARFLDHA